MRLAEGSRVRLGKGRLTRIMTHILEKVALTVGFFLGLMSIVLGFIVNEPETPGAPRLGVVDHLNVLDAAILCEEISELTLIRIDGQAKDSDATRRMRAFPIAGVTFAVRTTT